MDLIKELQKVLGVSADGIWGPISQAALDQAIHPATEPAPGSLAAEILRQNPQINPQLLAHALKWKDNHAITNKKLILLVDFSVKDSVKRMHVLDMHTLQAKDYKVAHGKNSDANKDGLPDSFSNQSGTFKSSLGPVAIGHAFHNPKWKYVRLLDGLEAGRNDHIRARQILFHSSTYVNDVPGKAIGDTLGCFGMSEATAAELMPKVEGALLYAWDDSMEKA